MSYSQDLEYLVILAIKCLEGEVSPTRIRQKLEVDLKTNVHHKTVLVALSELTAKDYVKAAPGRTDLFVTTKTGREWILDYSKSNR